MTLDEIKTALLSTLNVGVFGVLATIVVQWIKGRPKMREIEQDGDEKLRSEMWKDIEALKVSKDAMSTRLSMAESKIAGQTVQIGQLRFVSALVIGELDRLDPGNAIARQARVLLRDVQPDAMPHGDEVVTMAEMMKHMDPPPAHGGKP